MVKRGLIKSLEEIETLVLGGRVLARVLRETAAVVRPGVSAVELDQMARKIITEAGAEPSFLGYGSAKNPYPAALCVSINDVVVHGIPRADLVIKDGDIVSLDCGVKYRNLFTDAAVSVVVGNTPEKSRKLVFVVKEALDAAILEAKPGNRIGALSNAIQKTAEKNGFAVVRDLVGHGVGYAVHEDPSVPCFGKPQDGPILEPGMVLAIEPMITAGDWRVQTDPDGWTVRTADGSRSAHWEHTLAITENGCRVLTAE